MDKQNLRFAVCIKNTDYPASLELHKIYPVLSDEDAEAEGNLRVIDKSREDYSRSSGLLTSKVFSQPLLERF